MAQIKRNNYAPAPPPPLFALNVSKHSWPSCLISVIANVSVMKVVLKCLSVCEYEGAGEGEREG